MRWYFGLTHDNKVKVFRSESNPDRSTHGHLYKLCWGGYKTRRQAIQQARYQFSNAEIETVKG